MDGKYLWTGGHNFWDAHYLRTKPVNDLSIEMEGSGVTRDAHRYANAQWGYIVKKQSTAWGRFVDKNVTDAIDGMYSIKRLSVPIFYEFITYYAHRF